VKESVSADASCGLPKYDDPPVNTYGTKDLTKKLVPTTREIILVFIPDVGADSAPVLCIEITLFAVTAVVKIVAVPAEKDDEPPITVVPPPPPPDTVHSHADVDVV